MTSESQQDRLERFLQAPKRAVWTIAAPMMIGFSAHVVYSVVDRFFVGQLSSEALAAATYVGTLFFVVIALTNGLATGVTAVIAQAMGRGDNAQTDRIASNALALGLVIGLMFTAAGLLLGRDIMFVLGATGQTAELAWEYFQVIAMGVPLFFISTVIRSVLIGEGDAKTPMMVITISQVLNAALDPLFIFVLDFGIRGAALATVAAQLFSLAIYIHLVFIKKQTYARLRLRKMFPLRWTVLAGIVAIGLPAALGHLVMAAGMGLTNRLLAVFGQMAVAGYGAGSTTDMVVVLPILALAASTVTVIGIFAGAGRADLVRKTTLYAYKWAVSLAVILGGAAFAASRHVVGLFTSDPQALEIGISYIHYMLVAYPLMAFGMTSGRVLQGLGFGMPSLVITTLRVLLIAVPSAYIAVYVFDAPIEAVWISAVGGGFISDILAFYWVRKYLWKTDPVAAIVASK